VRIRERDDLPRVGRVGQDLLVAGDRRVEDDFAGGQPGRADPDAPEYGPVGERKEITFADLQQEVVRFANALKPPLAEMGRGLGSAFERDAAGVLRRVATLARDVRTAETANRRGFIDMLRRLVAEFPAAEEGARKEGGDEPPRSSLIVP